MEYSTYISNYNAQQERQAQLIAKYNQTPIHQQNRFLWAVTSVERHSKTRNEVQALKIIAGTLLAGSILVLSIWL